MNINKSIEHLDRLYRHGMSLPLSELREAARIGRDALEIIAHGSSGTKYLRWSQKAQRLYLKITER